MPLRKEDIERIEREAKENYSALFNCSNAAYTANEVVQNCINSYAAGATAEAEKANELVEQKDKEIETFKDAYIERNDAHNIATKEIERVSGLIEKAFKECYNLGRVHPGNNKEKDWQQFKTENNL